MSPQQRSRLRQEVELIGRFAQSYHKKMAELIGRLNGPAEWDEPEARKLLQAIGETKP